MFGRVRTLSTVLTRMASTREKRSTAGNRMSRLLDAEDEDEFYKTTYGGFDEEEEDVDYSSEGSGSDEVDSDFDIDEKDELKSDGEDDEPKRKKRGVDTKAYKEPLKKKEKKTDSSSSAKVKVKKEKKKSADRSFDESFLFEPIAKKSLRNSTATKTAELEKRQKDREAQEKRLKEIAQRKNVSDVRRLTQEELLEEAKHTERINLKSLEMYQLLELERRKVRTVKQSYEGPIIRYHSVTMPMVEEVEDINVEDESDETPRIGSDKCSRNFITFTEDSTFREHFPQTRVREPTKKYCVVSRQPARYLDPVTRLPFNNINSFQTLRKCYEELEDVEYGGQTYS